MNNFNFVFSGNIFFGPDTIKKIDLILDQEGFKNLAIIIDHNLIGVKVIKSIIDKLCSKYNVHIVECDISEPTYEVLDKNRISNNDKSIDVFIGIGGGSAIDMAKALSVLYTNNKPALQYRGFNQFDNPIRPIIAIPTTAGTGSEITPNASFIDTKEKKKLGINGEGIRPKYAILDPSLTLSCPKGPTISAGVDSLVHATEAFVSKKTNPMARLFAKEGFKLVFENLPILVNDLENIELREKVMYGAFLSAIALMNSGTGPAAAMSYPLGVHYGVPHGIGGGIFLPYVAEYNINHGFYEYGDLFCLVDNKKISKREKSIQFLDSLKDTWSSLDVPKNLNIFGLNRTGITEFVDNTMDLKGALDQNPVSFYEKEINTVLKKLITKNEGI